MCEKNLMQIRNYRCYNPNLRILDLTSLNLFFLFAFGKTAPPSPQWAWTYSFTRLETGYCQSPVAQHTGYSQSPVAQHTTYIARRTLSDVRLTQYDMLPQH